MSELIILQIGAALKVWRKLFVCVRVHFSSNARMGCSHRRTGLWISIFHFTGPIFQINSSMVMKLIVSKLNRYIFLITPEQLNP